MGVDSTTRQLKMALIENYADIVMEALKQQGVTVGDGGRFYEKLTDLLEEGLVVGELRT